MVRCCGGYSAVQGAPKTQQHIGSQHCAPHDTGYIGEFEFVDDHRAGKIVVELNGRYVRGGGREQLGFDARRRLLYCGGGGVRIQGQQNILFVHLVCVHSHRLNKAGAISPRYNVAHEAIEDWVSRLLPSRLVCWVARLCV